MQPVAAQWPESGGCSTADQHVTSRIIIQVLFSFDSVTVHDIFQFMAPRSKGSKCESCEYSVCQA